VTQVAVSAVRPTPSAEGEGVGLGAGGREGELQRALADLTVLTHELVEASGSQRAVPVGVDVDPVVRPRRFAVETDAEGDRFGVCTPSTTRPSSR
jgi:hypothetical protein